MSRPLTASLASSGFVLGLVVPFVSAQAPPPTPPPTMSGSTMTMSGGETGPVLENDRIRFDAQDIADFEKHIRPVLVEHCYRCHSAESERLRARLRLDSREGVLSGGISGPALVPGAPDESLIMQALRWEDDLEMPPDDRLAADVVADFERWIARGAADPRGVSEAVETAPEAELDIDAGRAHWAYLPPARLEPPAVPDDPLAERWIEGPIDAFVLASMREHGLTPVRDADRLTLLRRVTFDLTGLPPTPEEIDAFRRDRRPDAYERVVDRLIASPAFGERWGRHWLDVARFAESSGRENNILYPHAWRYRDYVVKSFNADKPYDRFLREQIAGDLLPYDSPEEQAEQLVATGYLAVGPKSHNTRGRAQFALDLADEQLDAIGQGILATTVACARCHDHKFDPIPSRDYYAMAGIFLSTDTRFGTAQGAANRHAADLIRLPRESGLPEGPTLPTAQRRVMDSQRDRLRAQQAEYEKDIRENGRRNNPSAARLRQVEQRLAILDQLAERYDETGAPRDGVLLAMGATEGIPRDARLLVRGELDRAAESVPRGFLSVLERETVQIDRGSGRLELANWITAPENPLTARVWVNRVWLHMTGRAIVPTPDNFGRSGQEPTHPELLDYLAVEFMDSGWSIKQLVKRIAMSHTYRLGSDYHRANAEVDPDAEQYWRMNPRRLEAEAIRDAMLAAAGTLDPEPRIGSDAATFEGPAALLTRRRGARGAARDTRETDAHRSIYLTVVRDALPESLEVFDFAEPSFVTGDRDETTVPSQALYLLNDAFVVQAADDMAQRLLTMREDDIERARQAFLLTLGRQPSPRELSAARRFFADFPAAQGLPENDRPARGRRRRAPDAPDPQVELRRIGWSAFCQALFATAEFRTID